MSAWPPELVGVVDGAIYSCVELPMQPEREQLLAALDRLATLLRAGRAGGPSNGAYVEASVTVASNAATALLAGRFAGHALLDAIGVVHSACLAAAEPPSTLDRSAPAPAPSRMFASGARPVLHSPQRDPFDRSALEAAEDGDAATPPESPNADAERSEDEDEDNRDPFALSPPPKHEPAGDDAVLPEGVHPPVRLVAKGALPLSPQKFYSDIVTLSLDQIAAAARDRVFMPFVTRPATERTLLASIDAIAVAARCCVADIVRYWVQSLESNTRWPSWAATFALSTLDGNDSLAAVELGLAKMPPDSTERAIAAAEALAVSPHSMVQALARDLLRSPNPVSRAAGLDVLGRKGQIGPQELARHLADPSATVMAAAARAASRMPLRDAIALVPLLQIRMFLPDPNVAWESSRTLLRWGFSEPYRAVQEGTRIVDALGARALDVLVLRGDQRDAALLQRLLTGRPLTPATLEAVARFGHPLTWRLLTHCLEDDDLADAAVDALSLLFGPLADPALRRQAPAWQSHIGLCHLEPQLRCRHGRPWHPGALANEHETLSAKALESRGDELVVRAGLDVELDPMLWHDVVHAQLTSALDAAKRADSGWSAGSWECRRRP